MTPTTDPTDVNTLITSARRALVQGDVAKVAALLDEAERLLLGETEAEEAA